MSSTASTLYTLPTGVKLRKVPRKEKRRERITKKEGIRGGKGLAIIEEEQDTSAPV